MTTHLEEQLQREIDEIRRSLSDMAGLVVEALGRGLQALEQRDRQLAYTVILRDRRIDEMEKQIDRLCLGFLVRQQPAGGQLRFAYGAIKINAELERIGDYAESIARQVLKIAHLDPFPPMERFLEIADLSISMLRDAIRAFLDRDEGLARKTMEIEVQADGVRDQISAEVFRLYAEQRVPLEALTPLLTIARRFERASDQAKNICEETVYVATGQYAKHPGAAEWRILFVDEREVCLSRMAVAIGRSLGEDRLRFESAGVNPGAPDHFTASFLAGKGMPIPPEAPRGVQAVPNLEYVPLLIALGSGVRRALPLLSRKAITLEWIVADPSTTQGSPEEVHAAYESAFEFLRGHLEDLAKAILGEPGT